MTCHAHSDSVHLYQGRACIQQRLRQQAIIVVVRHAVRGPRRTAQAPVLTHQPRPMECICAQVGVTPPQAAQRAPM